MTVIRPNSVSGITSITAQANEINFFRSNGALAGLQLNGVNFNTTTGVSTFNNLDVGGVLTYQDVTNVDSLGIGTFRTGVNVSGGQLDVGSNIKLGNAGVITATSFVGSGANLTGITQTTINNNANNRLITGSGTANTLEGESNLTYDGTNLQLITDANSEGIKSISNGNSYPIFELDSDRASAGNTLGKLVSKWNNTEVASISFVSGDDTSNKDNASIYLNTRSGGSGNVLRLRITPDGQLGTTAIVRSAYGGLDLCSQGATNYGTLTLGAGGGQNGQSRSSNQENQFRIMMPTYADPSLMTTVLYGTSGNAGHDLFYGGGTGWAYATNTHRFFTTANQTTGTGSERMRIVSNGEIGINITNPEDYGLSGHGYGGLTVQAPSGGYSGITIRSNYAGGGILAFSDGSGSNAELKNIALQASHVNKRLDFMIDGSSKMRLTTNGIHPNPSDTAAANALDDYEEGSYVVTVTGSSSGSFALNPNSFRYTKIGRVVHVTGRFYIVSGSPTGSEARVSLPFTASSDIQAQDGRGYSYVTTYNAYSPNNDYQMVNEIIQGTAHSVLIWVVPNAAWQSVSPSSHLNQRNAYYGFDFTYTTAT